MVYLASCETTRTADPLLMTEWYKLSWMVKLLNLGKEWPTATPYPYSACAK